MKKNSIYEVDSNPPLTKCLPISLQHVLTMLIGNVAPALIISASVGLSEKEQIVLVQAAMIAAAVATLVQVYGISRFGSRLPMVMGINFSFVTACISIGKGYGMGSVFGACIFGGIAIMIFGALIKKVRKFFPPLVTGITVTTIGMSLYPVAIGYMAGNPDLPTYGSLQSWGVALFTLIVVIGLSEFGKGYIKTISILIGLVLGYIVAAFMGMVDLSSLSNQKLFELPKIMPFGMKFDISAIMTMVVMYIVTSIEAIGDISSLTMGGMDREATTEEISNGIMGNGLSAIINAFFGGTPTATFSQNVGIVTLTKVANKKVIKIAAFMVFIIGILPKFGALMTSIPYPVLGGATLSVFAIITVNGLRLLWEEEFTTRNMTIIGVSLAIGMGITQVPETIASFPEGFQLFIGSSPVIMSTIVAFVMNLILPRKTLEQEAEERKALDK